jgi:anti-sigma regulatory factor (Ser/Thr protein kinase)
MGELNKTPRRIHRSSYRKPLKLFLENGDVLTGVSKDISKNSVSMFVSLKGGIAYLKNEGIIKDHKISLSKVKKFFRNQATLISLEDDSIHEPINLRILRVEPSWRKHYDIFIAGEFENVNEFISKEIESAVPDEEEKTENKKYVSKKIPKFKEMVEEDHPNHLNFEVNNSYSHVMLMRDFIASLAEKYHFAEQDIYLLKLISDEVLMNAFLYGSTVKGRDKTKISISINSHGVLIEVTDFAGIPFDDTPYHARKELTLSQLGGLALIEAYSDDWQIDTDKNVQTTLTFYKTNSAPHHEHALK